MQCSGMSKVSMMVTAGLMGWLLPAGSPLAAQTPASSSAFALSADLQAVPFFGSGVAATSGPLPRVSIDGLPGDGVPASRRGSLPSAALSTPLTGPLLRTGRLAVSAASERSEAVAMHGTAVVRDALITLGQAMPLLSLDAGVVRSAAAIDGACGSGLTVAGSADLTDVTAGGSLGLGLIVPGHPAPNTVLLDVPGVRIVLNEQARTADGPEAWEITVSAVHVYLRNAPLSGLGQITGDIVLARSQASVRCPSGPAPAADLALTGVAAPGSVAPGRRLTHTFTVTNPGPATATAVVFASAPPAGLEGVSAAASQGSCSSGTPILCTLGELRAGESVDVTVEGTVTGAVRRMVERATVTSGVDDPDRANNSLTLRTRLAQSSGGGVPPATGVSILPCSSLF
ncbi:MAG TPA: DUF11 domain-containing protein [Thermoanaerobaculia bacterium]|nr:DUF11 domain-containing protein [Thermoanaerobaculia bacterium]